MPEYVPMKGPFPGEQFEGSNGSDADALYSLCETCARDKELNGTCWREGRDAGDDDFCPVLAAALRNEAVEVREMPDGEVLCMARVPFGQGVPAPRCEHTIDMFEVA